MLLAILVLIVALVISGVAAYFSIVGLAALFAATATGVIVMASALEVGKIVTVKWVHSYWKNSRVKWWFKGVLVFMIACLMAVTSLGIYGYLSKGHLEQNAPLAGIELEASGLERQIAQKEAEIERLETRLSQIDQNISAYLDNDRATQGMRAAQQMKTERDRIYDQIQQGYAEINALSDQLVPLKQESSEVEAKLGPVKYVAELFGLSDPESAVRIVILLIMIAFDPLAICLVIAASISFEDWRDKRRPKDTGQDDESLSVESETPDEIQEITRLREELRIDAETTRDELKEIQDTIKAEREDLDIKHRTLAYELAKMTEREQTIQTDTSVLDAGMENLNQEAEALLAWETELGEKSAELDKREADIQDRVELLELVFPKGSTDDQAVVSMLERNPKILEDIIEIIDSAKPTNRPGSGMIVKKDS